jgi:formylglycine-generating enzyme required for sulfatase activity
VFVDPQIFITYSSKDQKVARTICTALENRGLSCWISSRNIKPGQNFQEQIVKAIRAAKIMVLVFTTNANNSNEIKKELALASQNNLVVIPVRIEDVAPNEAFAYEFATRQWIDLFDDWENSIARLVEIIASTIDDHPSGDRLVATPQRFIVETLSEAPTPRKAGWQSRRALLMAALLGVFLVGSVGVWVADIYRPPGSSAPTPVQPQPATVPTVQPPVQPTPAPVPAPDMPLQSTSSAVMPLSPDQESTLKPKDTFKECTTCPEMIVAPSGSFRMGSPAGELGRRGDEGPQHTVTFARQFAASRFTVTFEEWDACVANGGCTGKNDKGWGRGRQPAIFVSWNDASAYVAWLAKKTGQPYRLLTEAEQEYVTRAATYTPFWWGKSIDRSQANYNGDFDLSKVLPSGGRHQTLPVDSFQPNAWGFYQVHGNVVEWTEDCYHDSYDGAPVDGSAWIGGDCSERVVRGGSFVDYGVTLRAATRVYNSTGLRTSNVGFRVGRTLLAP